MSKIKNNEQLGMNHSTASNRLRKDILFSLIKRCEEDICFQCGKRINSAKELSIEHKEPWLDSEDPVGLFFSLENIAFSHLSCNSRASRGNKLPRGEALKRRRARDSFRVYCPNKRKEQYLRTGT